MGFVFEMLFDILFDFIFEGSLELGTSKKVSAPIRILAMLAFLTIVGGVLLLFLLLAMEIMKSNKALGWMVVLLDLFMAGCIIYAVRKKIKER